jgi:hypothetical protein
MSDARWGAQSSDAGDFVTTLCDPALAHAPKWRLNRPGVDYYGASVPGQSGSTRSCAICSPASSSSTSKIPVIEAGKEKLTVSPGAMSFIRS